MDLIEKALLESEQLASAPPIDMQRRWGARKLGEKYVVDSWQSPWVIKLPYRAVLEPDKVYVVEGIEITGVSTGTQIIVAVVSEGFAVGFFVSRKRRLFRCSHRTYSTPVGLQLAPYIEVRPLELWVSHGGLLDCVPRRVEGTLAIIPESVWDMRRVRVSIGVPVIRPR